MKQAQYVITNRKVKNQSEKTARHQNQTVNTPKDRWLGECLDDFLFKLGGTNQVVRIPKDTLY